ncbi:hypothetical protein AB0F46_38735 [Streptomyces sp. NPDC026665]|uniref:Mu transposase domain-containing protein n=1 Tax=Streptomyces sp. NPDC026665 TaxID=3154798 RepID=UPI0033FC456C
MPQVDSLDELNGRLAEFEAKEDERRIGARMRTIAQDFAREAGHLLSLPEDPFATSITLMPRVDRYGMVTVKMCRYSVPVRFIDRKVIVTLTCDDLTVYDGRREIARHRRLTVRSRCGSSTTASIPTSIRQSSTIWPLANGSPRVTHCV